MTIRFPPNARQTLFAFANDDLDLARNLALSDWLRSPPEMRADWIALVATDSYLRSDVICACIASGTAVSRVGSSYVLHRGAILAQAPPWFREGNWTGHDHAVDRNDLCWRAFDEAPAATPVATPNESGETLAKKTIMICVPSLGHTTLAWTVNAIMLQAPMACAGAVAVAIGHEVGDARQSLVDVVLAMRPRPEYTLFFGDDNLPPYDGLQSLLDTARRMDEPAVSGLYHIKHYPPTQIIMWRNDRPGPLIAGRDFEVGDPVRVDGCGLDFILFRTDALAKLPPRKFQTLMSWMPGRGMMMQTEDAFFFDRWREVYGQGPIVDTRVRVGHLDARTGAIY